MKISATYAIAQLAKEPVPEEVKKIYPKENLVFGRDYILPKAFDSRLLYTVAPAVAKAAMMTGVARSPISDWDKYREYLSTVISRVKKA